ncbi:MULTISPECIES: hypothetical protein [unclassified Bosea (in: a-proteobacteria)]|uniref:hypothetical protein n=1 Tax=unclassified Bosea (in: a-proteobacteria) TaxID=2653178 RepID=UPI000F75FED6|nr:MULTISPECIES: hypothetical protein [unclassified Bosea (in: a-proteobacteria)]AZO81950.1 hypothetical protein BLM15_29545 [Bosea sp. Tri-49]RXT16735.1 hypothetical protein B5U98_27870 [Bosea sp. Tri-39]RXT42344.1 hypothetical protein B5U99_00050 [Bosea sp. Tri-54]
MKSTAALLKLLMLLAAMAVAAAEPSQSKQPLTRIQTACLSWDLNLQRMLIWSAAYAIHPQEMRLVVHQEAAKLRERCTLDVTPTTINRYVLLSKMLHDDEADDVESFD